MNRKVMDDTEHTKKNDKNHLEMVKQREHWYGSTEYGKARVAYATAH